MEDKRKNLYDTLVADGYDLGDYDSFSKNINDSSKRKNLYDTVGEEYDLGDYNSFESKLGLNIESPVSVDGSVSVNPEIVGMSSIVLNPDRAYKEKEFSPTGNTHDSSEGVPEHLKRPVESPDVIKGFVPAFKQGSDALYQGVKSSVGETANLLNGSQRDYAKAQDQLQELVDSGYDLAKFDKDKALKDYKDRQYRRDMASWDEVMNQRRGERENMGFFDALVHKFKDPDRPRDQYDGSAVAFNKKKVGDEVQLGRAFDAIQEALTQANGDVKRAYALLGEQSAKETWRDKTSREAREAMREFKPTEGAAAWVGNMIPQMAGNAAAIAASVSPWTRWMARPLGAVNMGMLTASSSGSAMAGAREYAEQAGVNVSEGDVLRTGAISGAIEAGTEILPYERFFGGIHNFTANKLGKEVTNAIVGNQAARSELSNIIKKAAKDLPAKVFTKEAGKKFVGDVSVEGFSEFLAEGGGTLVPMIYQNPEDYPTLYEVLENGWEGAKGGIFMGSILGGASSTVGHYQNRARRKQQGEIMLADTQDGVLEVLGHIDGDKYMAVDGNGMPREITRDMVSDFQVVPFGEFDRYCRDQTDENLQKAVDGGRALAAEDIDRREKHAAKLELDKAEQMLSEEQKEGLDISPIEYLSEHENEADILIPYLNAKSKFDGMILGIRNAIDEKVSVSNQYITNLTHQDGNVYDVTLAADEKKHVFPVSGSIVVDENGIIDRKQSDSRFIVRDDAGKIEMRSIDDLYKLESSDNADVLKEVTAQSIREQESARHAEEIEAPSEEEKANDGFDDVGIDDYIGANNLSEFGEQRAYEKEEESIDIAKGQAKLSISYRNGEIGARAMLVNDVYGYKDDVSDERLKEQADELSSYWIKRYPEKIKVSDFEREILETNHVNSDVLVEDAVSNEDLLSAEQSNVLEDEKGLAINEMETGSVAGGTIDDIPAGATSIENVPIQEGIVAQSIEPEVPQENQAVVIPVDKKGNKVYHKAPVEVSLQDMRAYGLDDVETDEFVNAQKTESAKRIEKLEKSKPKVGTNLEKYQADKKAWADELVDAQAQVEYWNEVEAQVLAVREKPGDTTATEITSMGEPMSGSELAAMMLGNGKIPLLYGDYKKETGFKDKEASGMFGTFASKENGGLTIEQAGEQLMLADQEAGTNFFDQEDANAGRNVILDVLLSARTRWDLIGYISKGREAMAERERQAEYEAYEGWCDDTFHMAVEEYEAYEGGIAEDLVKRSLSEDEYNEFMSAFVDELKLNSNEQQGVNGESEGSGSVLHGEELIQTGRTGGIEEESTKVDGGFVDENGFVSESASSGEVDDFFLSDVYDNAGHKFYAFHGDINLWSLPESLFNEIGRQYAPIRLTDFNVNHIIERHGRQIGNDPARVFEFISSIFDNYTSVRKDGRTLFVTVENRETGKATLIKLYPSSSGDYYNVESAGYYQDKNLKKKELLWNESEPRNVDAASTDTLTGLSHQSAGNAIDTISQSNSFDDKDSEESENKQVNSGIIVSSHLDGESLFDYAERVVKANEIMQEREAVNLNPTDAQKEAGNYKKGHVEIDGFNVTIENPKGGERSGVDANGGTWSVTMNNDYGYIRGTVGVDGDHIDMFLSDDPTQGDVFVVDQVKEDGSFDEHKVMYGFGSMDEAKEAYLANYSPGWKGLGNITGVSKEIFKEWVDSSHRKIKAFVEYKIADKEIKSNDDIRFREEKGIANLDTTMNGSIENEIYRFAEVYRSKDCFILQREMSDDELRGLGIEDEHIDDIRSILDDQKTLAAFANTLNKIFIFANNINESDLHKIEGTLFHENIHGVLNDMYDTEARSIIDSFYNSAKENYVKLDSFLKENYDIQEVPEEFFTYMLENDMSNGDFDRYPKYLKNTELEVIDLILNTIGYDKQGEGAKRRGSNNFSNRERRNMRDRSSSEKDVEKNTGKRSDSGGIRGEDYTGTKKSTGDEEATESGDEIVTSVESFSKELNTPVRIVRDVNDLTDSDRDMLKRKRRSKGWYNPKTGDVVFMLPNAESIEDAVATILHEVVAHKGLREMFGKDFDGFLDNVYGGVSEEIRAHINRMAQKHGFDIRIATEEYLASLAERGFEDVHEKSAWEKIKELFSDMLRRVGVKLSKPLGDEDLRYILWKSMNRLKDGDSIVDKAEKIAKDGEVSDRLFRFRGEANDSDAVSDGGQKERLSKIERLQREINGLKGKIRDDKEDVESTVLAMQAFVSGRLSSEAAKEMTKSDIGDLIREIGRATKKRELESPMMAIERLINEVMIRKGSRELFELSRMKVQDSNNRGVSVAKKVDNGTRQVVEWIRNTFSDLITSGMERDIRRLGKEIGVVEREMNGIADSERNDGIYDELNDRLAVLREERDTLKEQRDDLLRNRVEETRGLIEQRMSELESKMQDVAEGRGVFTKDDGIEYDALLIRLMFVETRELTDGLLGIDRDIASVMEENRVLRKAHAEENKKPSPNGDVLCGLKSQMNVNQSKINGLRRERISMQRSLLEKISEANSALREIIETGKSNLQLFHRKLAERKMKLAGMAIGAVKEKRIKGLNEVKGKLERLGESVEDSMQLWKSPFKAPLYSFNFILKHMDRHNFAGDGELYRYFMKSNEGVNMAGDKYYQNWKSHATELEQKMKEVCGKDVDAVMKEQGKVYNHSGIHITMMYDSNTYGKAGTKRELAMSKGQAMYVWMVWQMEDGRAKLESQGYDEESLDEVRAFIGSDYVEFAQWVQDEFYPNLREERYNGTHEHLFGTSMAKRDHYFPLKYTTESGQEKQELGEQVGGMPSLVTGNIINRVRNSRDIDTGLSAFDVMYEYGKNMEEWNAYAAVRRDLNGLVTNRYLRNLMEANEKGLHREFRIACEVATRSFREDDKTGRINRFLTKANKGLAGGAIAWRLNTALKQLLSAPAFLDFSSNPKFIAVLMANSFGIGLDRRGGRKKMVLNYQWCMENLPSFAERIDSGNMGNEKLDDKGFADWIDKYIEMGMIPNKFVDAFTCSVGAKSVYDFARGRYLKAGLSESDAENKAKFDAAIAFNETQQSGRPEYMAAIQSSSHALWKSLTNFQNSNFGFYRKIAESFHDLTLEMQPQVDRIKEELMVTGENERKAERKAWKCVWGTKLDAVKRFALFGEIMSVSWALGSIGLMGWNGGGGDDDEYYDDDEKNSIVVAALFGPIMGTLVLGQFASTVASGNDYQPMMLWGQLSKSWDGLSRAYNERGFFSKPMVYEVCKQAMNTTGIRYETIENMVLGIEGIIRDGDWNMLDTMFLLNTPDSQRKKVTSRMFQKRGLVEYANEMARASKYLSKDGYWWVPGRKSPTEQRMSSIYSEWGKWQLSPENRDRYEKDLDKKRRANKIENNPDYSHQEKQEHIRSILQE